MTQTPNTIAVIGAGIVGVSTAVWLIRAGHKVVLIDKTGPAAQTSFGNAGLLASAAIVPVTTPGLIWRAPKILLDPSEPLFLKWSYLPRLMPWLARFLSHANARDARRIARALMPIIGDSLADHQALAASTGAEGYITPSDYVYLYKSEADFRADRFAWNTKAENGFTWREMNAADYAQYDPKLAGPDCYAAALPNHGYITDPGDYIKTLADYVARAGGQIIKAEVSAILRDGGRVTGLRAGGTVIPCNAAVLTTGAWSKPMARDLGLTVPLETERGYHLELWNPSFTPAAPTMINAGKFVATPMQGRLRLAGIVELGGLEPGPSRAPFDLMRKNLARVFPTLTWSHETEWMGHRPTLPDSLPMIGAVPGVQGAYVGFGHQHIGLTGGPKTGRILAQLISGQTPNLDLSPYAPGRFA